MVITTYSFYMIGQVVVGNEEIDVAAFYIRIPAYDNMCN